MKRLVALLALLAVSAPASAALVVECTTTAQTKKQSSIAVEVRLTLTDAGRGIISARTYSAGRSGDYKPEYSFSGLPVSKSKAGARESLFSTADLQTEVPRYRQRPDFSFDKDQRQASALLLFLPAELRSGQRFETRFMVYNKSYLEDLFTDGLSYYWLSCSAKQGG